MANFKWDFGQEGGRSESVSQINVNRHVSSDNLIIANHFNKFFTNVGEEIANSVPPVNKKPEDYINYGREIPNMQLDNTIQLLNIESKL